ncbi:MAG: phosphatase PAP2 family protein [Lachnospiraceae bacterium]|nr:phosphatase PAP2 family protein [Lachnospiraceae bacterium]
MKKQTYRNISEFIRNSEKKKMILIYANKILTALVYIAYPLSLVAACMRGIDQLLRSILIPAVCFVLLSVFRNWYNAPRPYEVIDMEPIIKKDTKGHSFPSRHVFSAFLISMVIFHLSKPCGVLLLFIATCIATVRVLGGVHFLKDVMVGASIGVLSWFCGNWLLDIIIK